MLRPCLALLYATAVYASLILEPKSIGLPRKWAAWKISFGRTYESKALESGAFEAWLGNDRIINEHNLKGLSFILGHNEFSDMTWEDFKAIYVGGVKSNPNFRRKKNYYKNAEKRAAVADAVDWVTAGAFTPVKNQGSGFTDVSPCNENALKSAVEQTPVTVVIEAEQHVFQLYRSGVFTSTAACGLQLDHSVLIVGYGTDGSQDYWTVKNSWGSSWGESGYIRMEQAVDCCGIASQPSYPTGAVAIGPSSGPSLTPGTSPTPTPSEKTHYGAPPCEADEKDVQVVGSDGDFCSPLCRRWTPCPADVPAGVTATPKCLLQDASGDKYCVLQCTPFSNSSECGTATCKEVQAGVGICMYDNSPSPGPTPTPAPATSHYEAPPCASDEENVQVEGIDGDFCAPSCNHSAVCPSDVPAGATARPECILQDSSSGASYCALVCIPLLQHNQCGTGTCEPGLFGSILGICTYSAASSLAAPSTSTPTPTSSGKATYSDPTEESTTAVAIIGTRIPELHAKRLPNETPSGMHDKSDKARSRAQRMMNI